MSQKQAAKYVVRASQHGSMLPLLIRFFAFHDGRLSRYTNSWPAFLHPANCIKCGMTNAKVSSSSNSTEPLSKSEIKCLVQSRFCQGKYSDLIRNAVSQPGVLLKACQNLVAGPAQKAQMAGLKKSEIHEKVSKHFSVEEMSLEILSEKFDIHSHCVNFSGKDGSLVLPDLKLKVFIEAIRIVLETVYDSYFVTFAYGGRLNMGRHTAIRYLKNSVENPSWWFTVSFERFQFDSVHVDRLCSVIEKKIEDSILVDVIRRLFEQQILVIQFGGAALGRGFPQECRLCPILLNLYFDSFDQRIQAMRLRMNETNSKEINLHTIGTAPNVFYKPEKLYAVRYLDEILLVTSGSKRSASYLRNSALELLEEELNLKVDKGTTCIHSAASEKIEFLGVELQAVPPSVLHPPMSDKATRARRKHLRQKEVKALENRNARERMRKRLGLNLFRHVFKKLRRRTEYSFDYHIEGEVRKLFSIWARETFQAFLDSSDHREDWHRMLISGEFLTLDHIRNQLPQKLVSSYDEFHAQVEKHLSSAKHTQVAEESERERKKDEITYNEGTVKDMTKLSMKVWAPIQHVRKAVRLVGFTNHLGRPRPIELLTALEDADIIKWYAGVGNRWLDCFCSCRNFKMVKTTVSYHLRFSCILTLALKHQTTKHDAIRLYSKSLKATNDEGYEEIYFPTFKEIRRLGDHHIYDPRPVDAALSSVLIRLGIEQPPHPCVAHFCDRVEATVYRLRLLQKILNVDPLDSHSWVPGMGAIHGNLDQICLPLCHEHAGNLFMGNITLQDIDCSSHVQVE